MRLANKVTIVALGMAVLAMLSGCAMQYRNLPVRQGTITDSRQSLRPVYKPSGTGAAVGAVAGGVVGSQVGRGNGKKLATVAGILGGAAVGAAAGGSEELVPYSQVAFRDDFSGEEFRGAIDGQWQVGMKIRFSVAEDGKVILR